MMDEGRDNTCHLVIHGFTFQRLGYRCIRRILQANYRNDPNQKPAVNIYKKSELHGSLFVVTKFVFAWEWGRWFGALLPLWMVEDEEETWFSSDSNYFYLHVGISQHWPKIRRSMQLIFLDLAHQTSQKDLCIQWKHGQGYILWLMLMFYLIWI